jgi:hypothetical protein
MVADDVRRRVCREEAGGIGDGLRTLAATAFHPPRDLGGYRSMVADDVRRRV